MLRLIRSVVNLIEYKPDCDKCQAPYYEDKSCPFWEGTFCSYNKKEVAKSVKNDSAMD